MDVERRVPRGLGPLVLAPFLAAAAVACAPVASTSAIPTYHEATSFLASVVALAQARDFDRLCGLGGGTCRSTLQGAGLDAVPATPPGIAGSRVVQPTQGTGGKTTAGGLVLQLCGLDGLGRPYSTEMLVFRDGATLLAIEPVYWSGMRIATDPTTPGEPALPFPGCPTEPGPTSPG
jgi:hypothetical protein